MTFLHSSRLKNLSVLLANRILIFRKTDYMEKEKIYQMPFSKVYQLLVNKATRKGRTQTEVDEIINWLTGYDTDQLLQYQKEPLSYGDFFRNAPKPNSERLNIKGSICGVKVEMIEEPLMRDIRILDKLVDELAKGKAMEKILRK